MTEIQHIRSAVKSWSEHDRRSEQLEIYACKLLKDKIVEKSDPSYSSILKLAAEAETSALESLHAEKTETIGVIAISAISLYLTAQERKIANSLANEWIDMGILPPWAIGKIRDLLQTDLLENSDPEADAYGG